MSLEISAGPIRVVLSDRQVNLAEQAGRETLMARHGFVQYAWAKQIHGNRVAVVDQPGQVADCDGLVTTTKGLPLLLRYADCFPVVVADPQGAIAVLHAGWRGTVGGVVASGVQALASLGFKPVHAWIGPGIRDCCFEVGEEVAAAFPPPFVKRGDRLSVDLARFLTAQLVQAGVERIHITEHCTACRTDLYFSYRKEGPETGRHGAVAWIQA